MRTSFFPTCFLFDNGSLRPSATLSLRRLAAELAARVPVEVRPVSLLHSSGVDAARLDGQPAQLLEPALLDFARGGGREAVLLPLFFGPSAALTDYVPARVEAVRRQFPELQVVQAKWLVDVGETASVEAVGTMLADAVRRVMTARGLLRPKVLLTDHGTPQRPVAAVRDALGAVVARLLQDEAVAVGVASMERREGDAYAFNEPLLERALRAAPFEEGDVIVALQFLQAGRHAGPEGDVAQICAAAERERPGLRTYLSEPLVGDPRLVGLLAERYTEAVKSAASAR